MIKTSNQKKALAHLKKVDPTIYKVANTIDYEKWFKPWERMHSKNDYFKSLCGIIVGQQLSTKAADTIFSRFNDLFNDMPTSKKVLKAPASDLRNVGLSNAKVKYVKDLATKVDTGELDLTTLPKLADEDVTSQLIKVKGIGTWSAEMFLIFNLGRENIFSYKDLGLLHGIEKLYAVQKADLQNISQIVEKWSPYKSYGSIALWHSINNKT